MANQWTAGTVAGEVLTSTKLNTIGAVAVDYTPTLTQGATVTKTVLTARYFQFQKFVTGQIVMNVTGAGTAANTVLVGLPIAARSTSLIVAYAYIYDANVNVMYNLTGYTSTTSTVGFFYQTGNAFGVSPAVTLANTDQISVNFSYEVA